MRSSPPVHHWSVLTLLAVLAIVSVIPLAAIAPLRAAADPPAGGVDAEASQAFVSAYADRHGLPGAAYVVVQDGTTVAVGGTGDVSADTPMPVASVSKSFTAFAVLQLVDAGRVDLDAPVTDHLPEFSVRGTDPAAITVRMLLSHTSGLPNPTLITPTGTLAGDVKNIAELTVAPPPGTSYQYSNLNYRTLARLVEVVAEQDFDSFLHDHVFSPLGMNDTTSVIIVADQDEPQAGHVTAYGLAVPAPELRTTIGGSGGVITTAKDMGA